MSVVGAEQLTRRLAEGQRGGVFFLIGDNDFFKEEMAARIVAAHLDPATRDFNFDQVRGGDIDPAALLSIAHTPPMMAEWRVVLVRDAHAFAASARARAPLEQLLEQKVPGLALILLASSASRSQFIDRLKQQAMTVEFPRLTEADLPGILTARAQERGVKLDTAAARSLASAIGDDLGILMQELEKLVEYVGERRRITRADVEAAVGALPRQDRWQWFDMVGSGDIAAARRVLPVLFDQGETGVGLVIGLGSQFLRIAVAVHRGEAGLQAVLPPQQRWLASRIVRQARRWPAARIDDALDDLLRADRLLKSTALGERAILEELLLRLEFARERAA